MKAIVYYKYGTPDDLELKEVDKPVPGDDEVLIKVHAASINDWDLGLLEGDFINRIINGLRKPKRNILRIGRCSTKNTTPWSVFSSTDHISLRLSKFRLKSLIKMVGENTNTNHGVEVYIGCIITSEHRFYQ